MRTSYSTTQEHEKATMSTGVSVNDNFYKAYSHHIAAMQIIAECAKVYILNNWEKIKDWSDLEVVVEDNNTDEYVEYFKYTGTRKDRAEANTKGSEFWNKRLLKLDEADKKRHNPAITVTDVVLDPSDGDFSITINGRAHNWISDETVIIISDYIEKKIK